MIDAGVEAVATVAQTKTGAAEVAEGVEVEAEVEGEVEAAEEAAAEVVVMVNPKTGGKKVRITRNKTEITKTKTVPNLHKAQQTHIKTKSATPAVP